MTALPRKAQICLWTVLVLGALTTTWVIVYNIRTSANPPIGLACLLVLAVFAGSRKVQIIRGPKLGEAGSMSLGFVIFFGTLLLYGPRFALIAALISVLSSCLFPNRQRCYQLLFNVALTVLEAWVAGVTFYLINGSTLTIEPHRSIPAAAITTIVYFFINTSVIASIIGFSSGADPVSLWKSKFLWTAPSYFAGASVSTMAVLLFHGQETMYLFLGAPIAYFTYQSYAIYVARAEEKQKHIEELQINQIHLSDLYLATVKSLALAIDAKDKYTHQHILRVQRYALAIAERLGLAGSELEGVRTGALLHDIGKLGVPEYVLLKPGRLTDEEFSKIKKHPEIGAAILDPVDFPWPVVSAVKYHHERWDGSGYPEGLAGEQIPLIARVLSVADVYDALTSDRPYRAAWTHAAAREWVQSQSGISFDPTVTEAFAAIIADLVDTEDILVCDAGRQESSLLKPLAQPRPISKSDQAAHAIQFASSELLTLYEIAQGASSCFGLEDTLAILGDKIQAILPGTSCLFMLRDSDTRTLRVRAARGINAEHFHEGRASDYGGISASVAQTHKSYFGEYDRHDLILTSASITEWLPLKSALIVPMIHQGDLLGTINLYHPEPDAFTTDYCLLLETIAERAARAINNGLMFDRTRSQAITDPLTGLYNMRYVTQYVEQRCGWSEGGELIPDSELTARNSLGDIPTLRGVVVEEGAARSSTFALFCMDLDSFKPVNDNFGHQKGDQVLRDLSAMFKSAVRDGDIVARYGGDEFLIVMLGASPAEAAALSARLQEVVEQYDPGLTHPELGPLRLGVSIGYSCYPTDSSDYASLLAIADTQMYINKTERKIRRLAQCRTTSPSATLVDPIPAASDESEATRRLPDIDLSIGIVQAHPARDEAVTHKVRREAAAG